MSKNKAKTLPVDSFPLARCKHCRSTRLAFSKSKLEKEAGEVVKRETYVHCLKCGRKSFGIFD